MAEIWWYKYESFNNKKETVIEDFQGQDNADQQD